MQLCNTKRNHFVPKFYLKNFINKDNKIFFFDRLKNKFHDISNLDNIACENNLYTIKNKINQADIDLFCNVFKVFIDTEEKNFFINLLKNFLNDDFTKLFKFNTKNKNIQNFLCAILKSPELSRNQELLFSLYENNFIPVMKQIIENEKMIPMQKNKDGILVYLFDKLISFIFKNMEQKLLQNTEKFDSNIRKKIEPLKAINSYSQNSYYDLLHYILIQCFRTKKTKDLAEKLKLARPSLFTTDTSAQNVMFLLIHYQTLNMTEKLVQQNYQIVLLKNSTKKSFFTSDFPSVNTHGEIIKIFGPENIGFEMFFPLSPKLALLLTNTPAIDKNYNKEKSEIVIDDETQIDYWNKIIFNMSERFIYSSSLEELELFIEKNCPYIKIKN